MKTETEFQTIKEAYLEQLKEQQLHERKGRNYGYQQADRLVKQTEKSFESVEKVMAAIEKHYNSNPPGGVTPSDMRDIKKARDMYKELKNLVVGNADNISNLYEE